MAYTQNLGKERDGEGEKQFLPTALPGRGYVYLFII